MSDQPPVAPLLTVPIPGSSADSARIAELEDELVRMRRDFSRRVAARTAELRKANEKLYQEIIQRRLVEQSLRIMEEKYRGFFEHAVEGAYQSTPKGKYLSINPALARLYGYDSVETMLAAVSDIARDVYVDPTMRRSFKELIERDGEVRNLEYQVRRSDGTPIWISENARVARGRRGRVLYYEGTIQDITRRKTAEAEAAALSQQLLQAQKMEAIGTLAGGVAHDFNNILGAILGYSELALDEVPPGSPAAANIAEVLQAARRAREHVRQILAFSRHSAPQREPVRVGPILHEALGLVRATIPSTIRIEREIATEADQVVADAAQLHQVIVNLCANASHAMGGRDGVLRVRLESVTLGPGQTPAFGRLGPGPYLKLSVHDTGHGIPPEVLPRIFDPFFTTKPVGTGTGLGLSVVHGILQSHGGDIQVESTPNVGSTFTVWLPASSDAAPAAPIPTAWRRGQGQRVLVIDDEPLLVRMLVQGLERLGYMACGETSSRKALEDLVSAPAQFDLIITDQTMPGLSGVELANAFHQIRPDIPIILCSGYADTIDQLQAKTAGIRGLLLKPMDFAQLSQMVGEALQPGGRGSSSPWPA